MYNHKMKKNFNKYARTYDHHSWVQKEMAKKLIELVSYRKSDCSSIYETGCGTGYYSELLLEHFHPQDLWLNDICPNMLQKAHDRLASAQDKKTRLFLSEADVEEISWETHYDLLTANAVFQWIKNLDNLILRLKQGLKPEGLLAFNIFTQGTFYELEDSFKKAYKKLDQPYFHHLLEFHDKNRIKSFLVKHGFKILDFEEKDFILAYDHPIDFLKSVRSIGASNFKSRPTPYSVMKEMFSQYKNHYKMEDEKIQVTYRVLFIIAEKGENK